MCPANVYLQCFDNLADTSITGVPVYYDNCEIDSIYFVDAPDLNSCGVGTVLRTWTVVDVGQSSASCIQTIIVEDSTPVEVVFPAPFNTSVCNSSVDPGVTGEPMITGDNCELVGVSSTDELLDLSFPACYTILRHWEVLDWCTYDANSGSEEGRWTYTQIITISDEQAPQLICPSDVTISTNAFTCLGAFVQLDTLAFSDCQPDVEITNDSPYADANGANASGTYPAGIHQIIYTVSDGCGNESTCSFELVVEDNVGPDMICENGLVVSLGVDGTVEVYADMILYSTWDNCSDSTVLSYDLTPSIFNCNHLGDQQVTLTVSDEAGNSNFCTTFITIQDNLDACPFIDLAGTILTEDGDPCEDVFVEITGGINQTGETNEFGSYSFPNVPLGGNFSIVPNKDGADGNGVNAFDLILLSQHILNIDQIDSPYKRIAADVNGSGSISTLDMVFIRRLILYLDTEFSNVDSWQFVDGDYVFNDSNPFDEAFPTSIFLNNQIIDDLALDFIGIKSGDVNNSANASNSFTAEPRTSQGLFPFKVIDEEFKANESIAIPFYCERIDELTAYQYTISYDKEALSWADVEVTEFGRAMGYDKNFFAAHEDRVGAVTHVWNKLNSANQFETEPLFILHFNTRQNGLLSETLEITSDLTKSLAYDSDKQLWTPTIEFINSWDSVSNLEDPKIHVYPNPVVEKLTMEVDLTDAIELLVEIYDLSGKEIFNARYSGQEGMNKIIINREELSEGTGILLFRIRTYQDLIASGKVLLEDSK